MGSPTTTEDDIVNRFLKFDLSTEEEEGVTILNEDFRIGQEECQRSLIGKIHGERKASFQGLRNTLTGLWRLKEEIRVRELGHNLFQFILPTKEACQKILDGRSWTFDNQFLVLQQWEAGIEEQPDLGSSQGRHIKLQIDIDFDSPLPRGTKLRIDEKVVWIHFKCELLPAFCIYFGRIGHGEKSCVKRQQEAAINQLKPDQYGDWLRATTKLNAKRPSTTNSSSPLTSNSSSLNPPSTQTAKAVVQSPKPNSDLIKCAPLTPLIPQSETSSLTLNDPLLPSSNTNRSQIKFPTIPYITPENKQLCSPIQINPMFPPSTASLPIKPSTSSNDPHIHKPIQSLPLDHQIQKPIFQPLPLHIPQSQDMSSQNPSTQILETITNLVLLSKISPTNYPEREIKSTCTAKESDPIAFSLSYPEPHQSEEGTLFNIPIMAGQITTPLHEVSNQQLALPTISLLPKRKGKWTRRQAKATAQAKSGQKLQSELASHRAPNRLRTPFFTQPQHLNLPSDQPSNEHSSSGKFGSHTIGINGSPPSKLVLSANPV